MHKQTEPESVMFSESEDGVVSFSSSFRQANKEEALINKIKSVSYKTEGQKSEAAKQHEEIMYIKADVYTKINNSGMGAAHFLNLTPGVYFSDSELIFALLVKAYADHKGIKIPAAAEVLIEWISQYEEEYANLINSIEFAESGSASNVLDIDLLSLSQKVMRRGNSDVNLTNLKVKTYQAITGAGVIDAVNVIYK